MPGRRPTKGQAQARSRFRCVRPFLDVPSGELKIQPCRPLPADHVCARATPEKLSVSSVVWIVVSSPAGVARTDFYLSHHGIRYQAWGSWRLESVPVITAIPDQHSQQSPQRRGPRAIPGEELHYPETPEGLLRRNGVAQPPPTPNVRSQCSDAAVNFRPFFSNNIQHRNSPRCCLWGGELAKWSSAWVAGRLLRLPACGRKHLRTGRDAVVCAGMKKKSISC